MNLMIIDDDLQIREGISKGIKWNTIGIDKVEAYPDGVDALRDFTDFEPDIIICDVRMPEMSGLEFLREAKIINPSIYVILISGYSDFEYVQQAIRLGAIDYELKPVNAKDLINKVMNVRNEILKERSAFHERLEYKKEYVHNMFRRILIGEITDYSIIKGFFEIHYKLERFNQFLMMIIKYNKFEDKELKREFEEILKGRLEHAFGKEVAVFDMGMQYIIIVQTVDSTLYMQNKKVELQSVFHGIQKLDKYNNNELTAIVSEGHALRTISVVYNKLLYIGKYDFYLGKGQCWEENFIPAREYDSEEMKNLSKNILQSIEKEENCNEAIDKIGEFWKACCNPSENEIRIAIVGLLYDIAVNAKQTAYVEHVSKSIYECYMLDDILEAMKTHTSHMLLRLQKEKENTYSHSVRMAIEYIEENYLEQITIEQVAEIANKSPNYLSSIFKKEVGCTFSIYVNQLRIGKSKELLRNTTLPLSEIACLSGYSDYVYFVSVFKKLEGCTPSSLRKN